MSTPDPIKLSKLERITDEMFTTERNFHTSLRRIEQFQEKYRVGKRNDIPEDFKKAVLSTNSIGGSPLLKNEPVTQEKKVERIIEVFSNSEYVQALANAAKANAHYITTASRVDKESTNLLDEIFKKDKEVGDTTGLNASMMTPTQRLPRYRMLLVELVKESKEMIVEGKKRVEQSKEGSEEQKTLKENLVKLEANTAKLEKNLSIVGKTLDDLNSQLKENDTAIQRIQGLLKEIAAPTANTNAKKGAKVNTATAGQEDLLDKVKPYINDAGQVGIHTLTKTIEQAKEPKQKHAIMAMCIMSDKLMDPAGRVQTCINLTKSVLNDKTMSEKDRIAQAQKIMEQGTKIFKDNYVTHATTLQAKRVELAGLSSSVALSAKKAETPDAKAKSSKWYDQGLLGKVVNSFKDSNTKTVEARNQMTQLREQEKAQKAEIRSQNEPSSKRSGPG